MKDAEAVELLKRTYKGMSKSVYSMSKKPERYGVELTLRAKAIIGLRSRNSEKRRKPYKITFRLAEAEFEQFELARAQDTRQDFCETIIKQALGI